MKRSDETNPKRRGRVRRFIRAALMALGVYLGLCAGLAWQTVRPKHEGMTATPAKYAMPYEPVAFPSSDGTRLAGWFIRAAEKPRGVIVLCHGIDSTRAAMLRKAEILHAHDYAALLFDFRARGESGGDRCTIGYREPDDLLAAIHYLKTRPDTKSLPIGVFGESMGGAVALLGTARCPDVRAVVAESPFARLDHAVDNHFREVLGRAGPILAAPVRRIGERLIGRGCEEVSPAAEIAKIAPRPLLLIQDEADILCPPEETRRLMAVAHEPKQIWTVPVARHIEAEPTAHDEFARRITSFFDEALK